MADNQAFIESGVLEAFVLGIANEGEKQAVINFANSNAKYADYLIDLEIKIKGFLDQNKISPPLDSRHALELRIQHHHQKKSRNKSKNKINDNEKYLEVEVSDSYIKVHKNWRSVFIAVFILSKIFLILGLYFYFKSSNLESELLKSKSTQIELLK